ncbi:VirD4-like conjugal transfer protein, CD1115 family [uncultured Oscillibacter sp.]|uniref:VirD4-like conjugal transfer protein, CD1115 family n=2 Tax=uncultured Oscillibacter sp. TaxID=876091 RepID=UPI00345B5AA7
MKLLIIIPIALAALLYGGGYISQFLYNYDVWQAAGGTFGTAPEFPDSNFFACIGAVFRWPHGLYGVGGCVGALAVLICMVMRMGYSETGEYDRERNLIYSSKGTYGTAGFMAKKELKGVLDLVPNIRKHPGIILGEIDGEAICVPLKTRFNGNLAVYGASGSKKTRAFCMNMILQSAARRSSLVICDPKSELYEKSSAYLRDQGYTVKVFNLVTPAASDSWNCLSEIEGQELMAQLFCDVIIKNTGSDRGDHFWDSAELNLLKALVLYVERGYPEDRRNIGEVYQLLAMSSEKELNALFDVLPVSHPAKAPYSIFKQSSESVRGGVIIGLGSRLQVFQNKDIRNITGYDEIDLELPGKQPCAYYCITSDQDSTFDFLSSLFLSFIFIKLVRYADQNCPGGALPVPVHVLGEELCACGVIPDLSRKISVIRSRNISMSCVFQNLAGLQNRYPLNQWQEILGNCDITLFLGCTDALTAQFISDRTGEASIAVTSKAKQLGTWRISNYTPEYRETSGVGKRKLMTMDEVLRMDVDRALVILRGRNVLEVDKYDYSKHPEAKKLRPSKAASHIPAWQSEQQQAEQAAAPAPDKPKPPRPKAPARKAAPAKPPAPPKPPKPEAPPPVPAGAPREPPQEPAPPPPPPRRSTAKPAQKPGQRVVTTTKRQYPKSRCGQPLQGPCGSNYQNHWCR